MKFAKVVILAGALAVAAFSQVAHSQHAATSETSQDLRVAEWSKNVWKDCIVFTSRNYITTLDGTKTPVEKPIKATYKGILYKATDSWVRIIKPVRYMEKGKEVSGFAVVRIPIENVTRIEFEKLEEKK